MISASAQSKHRAVFLAVAALTVLGCRGRAARDRQDTAAQAESESVPSNLEGVVQDRGGQPIPDALVIAWPKGRRGQAIAQARSTDDGRFILPALHRGRWSLLVEAGGIGTLETERQIPEDGSAVLMLDGSCRSLTGVVDAAGQRQAGAVVALAGPSMRWTRSATSDSNGVFSVDCLSNGRFTLRATLGKQASPSVVVSIDESQVLPAHVRLTLLPGIVVEGRVVDDKGRALGGVSVDVMAVPSDDLPISTQSREDGAFRLGPVAPGRYQILSRRNGYVPTEVPEPRLGGRAVETFHLRLARTARLGGRVIDERGRPMAAVQVFAVGLIGGHDEWIVVPGPLPLAAEAAALPAGQLAHPGGARAGASDEHGRFVIEDVAPGRARIEILHPGMLPLRHEALVLAPGETREVGDLTVSTGATLAGRVVDDGGQPVEGALVEARASGRSRRPFLRASTDAKGEFFLRVPLGEYEVTAQTEKLMTPAPLSLRVQGDLVADACTLRVSMRPKRSGHGTDTRTSSKSASIAP